LRLRVKDGLFREDLYYRLAVVPVQVPPLRERSEDLPELARHFLNQCVEQLKAPRRAISVGALEQLGRYDFPGNVRELRNLIERACILCRGEELTEADFPLEGAQEKSAAAFSGVQPDLPLRETLEQVELQLLRRALDRAHGNQAKAARRLGISRSDMSYKLKKFGLRAELDAMGEADD
jgi:two-component system NtrC family response regulator